MRHSPFVAQSGKSGRAKAVVPLRPLAGTFGEPPRPRASLESRTLPPLLLTTALYAHQYLAPRAALAALPAERRLQRLFTDARAALLSLARVKARTAIS